MAERFHGQYAIILEPGPTIERETVRVFGPDGPQRAEFIADMLRDRFEVECRVKRYGYPIENEWVPEVPADVQSDDPPPVSGPTGIKFREWL